MAQTHTTSMVLTEPEHIEEREFPLPEVTGKAGFLEVEMTSICGSDLKMYRGNKRSRNHCPLLLGHEVVGRIADAGEAFVDAHGVDIDDRVVIEPYIPCYECEYCQRGYYQLCTDLRCYGVTISADEPPHLWGGYGDHMYIAPNAKLHPIAETVPSEAACLSSVIGNGVRWTITKGGIDPTESVVVIGPGVQGLATTLVASIAGADPIVLMGLPTDDARLAVGETLGATHTVTIGDEDPATAMADITDDGRAEMVVVTAPSTEAIELGTELVSPLGRMVLPATTNGETASIVTDELVRSEIDIITGLGQPNNMADAIAIVEKHPDLVEQMITHTFPVVEAETAIRRQLPERDEHDERILHAGLQPT